jgi:hypothetical protein
MGLICFGSEWGRVRGYCEQFDEFCRFHSEEPLLAEELSASGERLDCGNSCMLSVAETLQCQMVSE